MSAAEQALTTLRVVTAALLGLGAGGTVLVVGRWIGALEPGDVGPLAALWVWLLLPYVVLGVAARFLAVTRLQGGLVLAGSAATTVVGLGVLVDALVVHPALLNFLVLLAVPNLQWMVVLPTLALTAAVRWLVQRPRRPAPLTDRAD